MRRSIVGFVLCLMALGCLAGDEAVSIAIPSVTKKQVADALAARFMGAGLQIRSANDYGMVAGKPNDSFAARLLFGSSFNGTPESRVSASFVDVPGGVAVSLRSAIVGNPGSGFERVNDMTENERSALNSILLQVRTQLAGASRRVVLGVQFEEIPSPGVRAYVLRSVQPGGLGERSGLRVSDVILSIDGQSLPQQSAVADYVQAWTATRPGVIKVRRGEEELELKVTPAE
jgi:S1-C subfamily serine protease